MVILGMILAILFTFLFLSSEKISLSIKKEFELSTNITTIENITVIITLAGYAASMFLISLT